MKRHKKYLTDDELEMLEDYRAEKSLRRRSVKPEAPDCPECLKEKEFFTKAGYSFSVRKISSDGLCKVHWWKAYGQKCAGHPAGLYPCNKRPKAGEKYCNLHKPAVAAQD